MVSTSEVGKDAAGIEAPDPITALRSLLNGQAIMVDVWVKQTDAPAS